MFRKRTQELLAKMGLDPATLQQATGRIQTVTTTASRPHCTPASISELLPTGALLFLLEQI